MKKFILLLSLSLCPGLSLAEITLTFGGDVNLNPSRGKLSARGAQKHGTFYTWQEMFAGLAPLIDGDLNFANIETVVSDRNLPDTGGKFTFITHPEGFAHAIEMGFNLLSLSNNHIGDYGVEGMEDTLYWLEETKKQVAPFYHAGLAKNRKEALKPTLIPVTVGDRTYTIAFMAMTAVANKSSQVTASSPGTLYFKDNADLTDALAALKNTKADYKIFSVHGGKEGKVTLDEGQRKNYRRVLKEGDVDLVLGHHPHRVRPIEKVDHRLIFYSLGNYQMLGAANINGSPSILDYGLLGKLHLAWDASRSRLVAQAAEIVPLYDMHSVAKNMSQDESWERVELLNELSTQELGDEALLFSPDSQGFGVTCLGTIPGPRAQNICKGEVLTSND